MILTGVTNKCCQFKCSSRSDLNPKRLFLQNSKVGNAAILGYARA